MNDVLSAAARGKVTLEPLWAARWIEADEGVDRLETRLMAPKVRGLLMGLTSREHRVIAMRYGISCAEKTLAEVGSAIGLSPERVRQIEGRAIRKLRRVAVAARWQDTPARRVRAAPAPRKATPRPVAPAPERQTWSASESWQLFFCKVSASLSGGTMSKFRVVGEPRYSGYVFPFAGFKYGSATSPFEAGNVAWVEANLPRYRRDRLFFTHDVVRWD